MTREIKKQVDLQKDKPRALVFESDFEVAGEIARILEARGIKVDSVTDLEQFKRSILADRDNSIQYVVSGIALESEDIDQAAAFLGNVRPKLEHFGVATGYREEVLGKGRKVLLEDISEIEALLFGEETIRET